MFGGGGNGTQRRVRIHVPNARVWVNLINDAKAAGETQAATPTPAPEPAPKTPEEEVGPTMPGTSPTPPTEPEPPAAPVARKASEYLLFKKETVANEDGSEQEVLQSLELEPFSKPSDAKEWIEAGTQGGDFVLIRVCNEWHAAETTSFKVS